MAVNNKTTKKTNTTTTNKKEPSAYEQELINAVKKVKEFKLLSECNVVSIFYKNPELFYGYDNLKIEDFSNNIWKVYFAIAYQIVLKEKKQVLDEVTVGLYLEKHDKLKAKYEEYGGYDTIDKAKEYVKEENLAGYISELHKWNAVIQLLKMKFPVYDKLSEFADMDAEEIYTYYETHLNHIFINVEGDVKSFNLCDNIHKLIDDINSGIEVGLPLHNSQLLNKEIGGNHLGHITLLGALSGIGKTTTSIEWLFPSIINHNEKLCMIINEEDEKKIQKEMIIWVANNVFKEELPKYKLRDGKFDETTMGLLRKCANWIEEKKENKNITIIPLERYTTDVTIKIIKKYASLGCNYFILDTLKPSANSGGNKEFWLSMQEDMVRLYDVIKPTQKNVALWVTYQLGKSATKSRHYTNEAIGLSRSIVDVASCNLMIRSPFDDEYEGGKNEIKCYRLEGVNKNIKIPFQLEQGKRYTLTFICKNRFGVTDHFQIVSEHNLSTNTYKEIGIANIPMDW